MTIQNNLFDAAHHAEMGRYLRDQGIASVEANNLDWVDRARQAALFLAAKNGEVDIEAVYACVGTPPAPNAAGAVFRGKQFRFTGRRRQATRSSRHAGEIRIWELAK